MEDFSIKRTRNTIKIFFAIFNTTIITPKNKVRLAKSKFLKYIREAVFFYKDVYSYNILEGHLVGERKMSRAQLRSQQYSRSPPSWCYTIPTLFTAWRILDSTTTLIILKFGRDYVHKHCLIPLVCCATTATNRQFKTVRHMNMVASVHDMDIFLYPKFNVLPPPASVNCKLFAK